VAAAALEPEGLLKKDYFKSFAVHSD
jgi:hypothetical protein